MSHSWPSTPDDLHSSGATGVDPTVSDPIVDEVRAIRDAYAKSLGYDLSAIVADLRSRQAQHPELLVSLSPNAADK